MTRFFLSCICLLVLPSHCAAFGTGSCNGFCDQELGDDESCFCDSLCEVFSDCCDDYEYCSTGLFPTTASPTTASPTTSLAPSASSMPSPPPTTSSAPSVQPSSTPSVSPTTSTAPSSAPSSSPTISTISYQLYTTGGCVGRNELGKPGARNVAECVAACNSEPACVSFEIAADGTEDTCNLSSSCNSFSMTVQDPNDRNHWYLKLA